MSEIPSGVFEARLHSDLTTVVRLNRSQKWRVSWDNTSPQTQLRSMRHVLGTFQAMLAVNKIRVEDHPAGLHLIALDQRGREVFRVAPPIAQPDPTDPTNPLKVCQWGL